MEFKERLKLMDFEKDETRTDMVTLYFGDTDCEDYWGDDWNDAPYEHNAGKVYSDYWIHRAHVKMEREVLVEPANNPTNNSGWSKSDFKERRTPCLLSVPCDVIKEYEQRTGDWPPNYYALLGHPSVHRIYFGDSYAQVMNNLDYKEPERDAPKEEETTDTTDVDECEETHKFKAWTITAEHLQRWINHLDEDEKHLPIFVYDEEKRYYGLKSILLELTSARDGVPPSSHYLIKVRRYKTSSEVREELEYDD